AMAGVSADADRYRSAAGDLAAAIRRNLALPSGGVAGSLEEARAGAGALDAAVVEGVNWAVFAPGETSGIVASLAPLHVAGAGGVGYMRNDDGGSYDSQEWAFVDLRIAAAWSRAGDAARA